MSQNLTSSKILQVNSKDEPIGPIDKLYAHKNNICHRASASVRPNLDLHPPLRVSVAPGLPCREPHAPLLTLTLIAVAGQHLLWTRRRSPPGARYDVAIEPRRQELLC